jgi:rsbT antagonist protein RsbS
VKGQKPSILRNEDVVIVPLQGDLDDVELQTFEVVLLEETSRGNTRGLLLDISSVDTIDHFMARKLIHIVRMVGLMDVSAVLVGMKPSVAITLTEMNVSLSGITTALNLEKGLAALSSVRK